MKRKKSLLKNIAAWVVIFCLSLNTMPSEVTFSIIEAVSALGFDFNSDVLPKYNIVDESLQATINQIAASASESEPGQGSIKLDKDYAENLMIPDNTVVSIDLNGHKLSPVYSGDESQIAVYGTLKISDSVGGGALSSDGTNDIRAVTVVHSGKFILENAEITNYYSSGNGAAVRVEDNGYFNMKSGKLSGNRSDLQGGAVFAFNANGVDFSGGEISGNSALNGGGIMLYLTEGISESSRLSISGVKVLNNTASGNGGGLYVERAIYLDVTDASFDGNTAQNGGGIYFANTANVSFGSGSSVSGNSAKLGGGIYFFANSAWTASSFKLDGGKINDNTSEGNGGGVCFHRATSSGRPSVIVNSGEISGNTSGGRGGGISIYCATDVTVNGGEIRKNSALSYGGGVYIEGYNNVSYKSVLSMNGGLISENFLSYSGSDRYGSGVYTGWYSFLNLNGGEISRNYNAYQGAGLYSGQSNEINISDGMKFSENKSSYGGPGLYADYYCTVNMTGGEFSGNVSENGAGGGMCIKPTGSGTVIKINITGGRFIDNNVATTGGAIFSQASINISGSTVIRGNTADSNGGGLYIQMENANYDAVAKISDSAVISGNTAKTGGGGVFANARLELAGDSVIENNTATSGGGVYCNGITVNSSGATLEIRENAIIRNNTATGSGGGVYGPTNNQGSGSTNFVFKMKGGQIVNNTAGSSGGGICMSVAKNQYFTGGVISGNTAGKGGGVWIAARSEWNTPISMEVSTDMTISGNTAKTYGGGICLGSFSRLELYDGGKIINNTAGTYGGGVFTNGYSSHNFVNARTEESGEEEALEVYGGELHDNTADSEGKDIYVSQQANLDYAAPYLTVAKATEMENAPETAYWLDETKNQRVDEALDNRERIANNVSPLYSAYTFMAFEEDVAKIGETTYPSVQAAVDAVEADEASGHDIVMLKSNSELVVIPENLTVSIDFHGYTLKGLSGSVITVNKNASLTVKDSVGGGKITNGTGTVVSNQRYGGAIYIDGGSCVVENVTISGNSARYGAAVYAKNNGSFELKSGIVKDNTTNSDSAIILMTSGSLKVSDSVITNNQNTAIYLSGNTTADIRNTEISKTYGSCGIAISCQNTGAVSIEGCQILDNAMTDWRTTVTIANSNLNVYIKDTLIKGNTSLQVAGIAVSSGSVILENCEITENKATRDRQGGVSVGANASLSMKDSRIYNNKSDNLEGCCDLKLTANSYFKNLSENYDSRAVENWDLDDYDCWIDIDTSKYYVDNADDYNSDEFLSLSTILTNDKVQTKAYYFRAGKAPDVTEPVAEIVTPYKQYGTLSSAVTAAKELGGEVEIKLLKDITESTTLDSDSVKIRLDLCGHTITAPHYSTSVIYVKNGGDVTLCDSVGGGKITPPDKTKYEISNIRGVYVYGGTFTLESGEISGFDFTGSGAGIYRYSLVNGHESELYIKGGKITNNTATGSGGGIYCLTGANSKDILEITDGEISGNSAANGGGIYFNAGNNNRNGHSKFFISGGVVENNYASTDGGGIFYNHYDNGQTVESMSEVKIYGCEINDNTAERNGGGIYAGSVGNNTYPFIVGDDSKKTIFSGNYAASNYGAIYAQSKYANTKGIVFNNVEVKENKSVTSGIAFITAHNITAKNADVHDNESGYNSGLYVCAGGLLVENCNIYKNKSTSTSNVFGAGLYLGNVSASLSSGEKLVKNCKMHDNSSRYGAGLVDGNCYDVTFENCEVYNNTVTGLAGGVLFTNTNTSLRAEKLFKNCNIHDNYAKGQGGGIGTAAGANKTIILENTKVTDNTAVAEGGGVIINRDDQYRTYDLKIREGTEITGNTSKQGGGVYFGYYTGSFEMTGGLISNNTATSYGGGIFYFQSSSLTFKMSGGEISNNTAPVYGGGVCFLGRSAYAEAEFSGGKILGNTSQYGGGIFFGSEAGNTAFKSVTITGTEIAENHAEMSGGGLYIHEYCTATIETSGTAVIRNNTAGNFGGGVYVSGNKGSFSLKDGGKLYGNVAFLGNDVYIGYNSITRNSDLYLLKASEMFSDSDEFTANAWLEEVGELYYTDIIKIRPLTRSYAYTLSYRNRSENVVAVFDGKGYPSVQSAVEALGKTEEKSGEIVMVDDSVEAVTIGSGMTVTLNLNGHTLKNSGIATITNRGTFTITDEKKSVTAEGETYSEGTGTGTITGTAAKAGGGIHVLSGKVTLKSGTVSGCKAGGANTGNEAYGGAGVAVSSGEFVLDGGTIRDNTAPRGSAVLVMSNSARFTMLSGFITNNKTSDSSDSTTTGYGAVYNNAGKVNILGGTISENTAYLGAALYNTGGGTSSIVGKDESSAPQIINNNAGLRGGGIYIYNGTVILENAVISGNKTTYAKHARVDTSEGILQSAGGGIYVNTGTLSIGNGTIMERNSAVRGGAIYQYNGTVQITGAKTRITKNTAQMGGGCAQYPLPGNMTTSMTLADGASVYANKSTFTSAGNDFYSAWEGSNTYQQQLGNNAQNTPRLNLIPAASMTVGERYNVWKNDSYNGTQRTGISIVSGQYITSDVVMGNNVQLTASYYDTNVSSVIDSMFYVSSVNMTLTDGSEKYDNGTKSANITLDNAAPEEKKASDLLGNGASESSETYTFNGKVYNYIEYNNKLYEQNQAVRWWPGDDSSGSNLIVRSFDTLTYTFDYAYNAIDGDNMEDRDYNCRIRIKAVLPCSSDEAVFTNPSGLGILNAVVTPSTDEHGNSIQILTGYVEKQIKSADKASGHLDAKVGITVYGMSNGSLLKPTFEFWFSGNDESPHGKGDSETVTVSASPKYNITMLRNEDLAHTGYFDMASGTEISASSAEDNDNAVYGTMLGYGVTASLYNDPTIKGLKGLEIPKDGIEFDLSFNGELIGNGTKVDGGTDAPRIWAYKENNTSKFGRALGSSADTVNMNWDDEDSLTSHSYYAYGAAPYNTGTGNSSCYSGGGWTITPSSDSVQSNETKVHVKITGYSINSDSNPSQCSGGGGTAIFGSSAVKPFSAGYIQVILPLNNIDSEHLDNGYYQISMNSVVSGLVAEGVSGQNPNDVLSASDLYTEDMKAQDLEAMNGYYSRANAEDLITEGLAVGERRYVDNYLNFITAMDIFTGIGRGNSISKRNLFLNSSGSSLNGTGSNDTGRGDTPLNSTVWIDGSTTFLSDAIDTSDKNSDHYIGNDPLYDSQLYSVIEYNYLTALNILQKFDADAYTPVGAKPVVNVANGNLSSYVSGAFSISTSETAASWSTTATQSYNLTILYAAKHDGKNWEKLEIDDYDDGGAADMDKYKEENLLFFTSLDDLHSYLGEDAKCVAILYEFRNCCIRTGRSVTARAKMEVTGDFEKVGHTYCTTNDVRGWVTYRPHFKIYYSEGTRADHTYTFNWANQIYREGVTADGSEAEGLKVYGANLQTGKSYSDISYYTQEGSYPVDLKVYSNGYIKTRYKNGSQVPGTHNGMWNGNTLLLYSLDTKIALNVDTKVKNSDAVKMNYIINEGEREVRYRVTPTIHISSSAKKTELIRNGTQGANITITLKLQEGLNYKKGSVFIDYASPDCGYSEGDLQWEEEYDGAQTVYLRTYVSDIEKTLPEIYFECTIGDEDDPTKDIQKSGTSLVATAQISAEYYEISLMAAETHSDSKSIVVVLSAQEGISKSIDESLTELGEDITFTLHYGNNVKNKTANIEAVDVLSHNGDGRGTDFTGGYRITKAEISFTSQSDYENFRDAEGLLYFGKDKKQWSAGISKSNDDLNDLIESVKDGERISVSFTEQPDDKTLVYDFSALNLITYSTDTSAYTLYTLIPKISGEQRAAVRITVTPKDRSGDLIESSKTEDGDTITETQIGGNVYYNSFYYRKQKTQNSYSYTNPLLSNNVNISVINRMISGTVWMDQDRDGLYNTSEAVEFNNSIEENAKKAVEYPIGNIKATLCYLTGEGQPDLTQKVKNILGQDVEPVFTDSNGKYSFENLAPGEYTVVFTEEADSEYKYMTEGSSEGTHPIDFDNLSVTTSDYLTAVRGNKCAPNYDATDKSKLLNGTVSGKITLPTKDKIPTVQFSSPNWNLGLYYTDLTVEKRWENMVYGVPDNTEIQFKIIGNELTSENEVYKATLTMSNESGSVKCTYQVIDPVSKAGSAEKKIDVLSPETNVYYWNLSSDDRLALQARNADEDIVYSVEETVLKSGGKDVMNFYNRYIEETFDEITKKITYSAINSQILGSVTIVKKTGAGEALEGAEFSIYQTTEKTKDESKFYGAREGVGVTLTNPYYSYTSTKYYKVILGSQSNLNSMNSDTVRYNSALNELNVDLGGVSYTYKIHKENVDGNERFYYYTSDYDYTFEYNWILGGQAEYEALRSENIINVNDVIEFNGVKYYVYNRTIGGVVEYYVKIAVSPQDFDQVAIVEFVNLPFYDSNGNEVYYTVRETGVPKGFIALADFNQLTEIDLFQNDISAVHDFCFEVENTKQMELPVTGGSGMSTTVILGTLLFAPCTAYIIWLVLLKKRRRGIDTV